MGRSFIGQYEVISRLGAGGMGTVVLARAPDGRLVVIKQPHPGDDQLRDLLINEARVGLRLRHPNIVQTVDFFELEGQVSLVLSYVSGVSLQDLREAGPVPLETICRVGQQICEALDTLHHAADDMGRPLHIVHRDVTPGNIMIGHDGDARLIDLGIAKSDDRTMNETQTGFLRGTIRYLAPEIFGSSRYSPQSDMWALGISLLDAALGRPALPGADPEVFGRVMARRIFELQPGEHIDPRLERILRKLLDYEHEHRPSRGKEAAALFAMLAKDLGDTKEPTCARVRVVAGVAAAPSKASKDPDATELLVEQATNMYGVGEWGERLLGTDARPAHEGTIGHAAPEEETEASAPVPVAVGTPAVTSTPPDPAAHRPPTARTPSAPLATFDPRPPSSLNDYLAGLRALEKPEEGSGASAAVPRAPLASTGPIGVAHRASPLSQTGLIAAGLVGAMVVLGLLGFWVGSRDDANAEHAIADAGPVAEVIVATPVVDAGPQTPTPPRKRTAAEMRELEAQSEAYKRRIRALESKRPKMPNCYEAGRTKYFWYLDKKGTIVTATQVADVPRRYRTKIRCAD